MIVYTLQQTDDGQWNICREQTCLASRLTLARAITEARKLARDQHARTGLTTSVDLISPERTTRLGHYAHPNAESDDTAVA
ncbi:MULTISPECIES: hypothetical protein [unclassified Rhodanobacter]|uniref:DUF2188 domain-containing protein n=1 Tax=Rhodanobacter humi TaxID=1888173 RepID=A0ABV4AQ13_9GAMM